MHGVRGPDGTYHTGHKDIDQVLWDSRKHIWATAAPMGPSAPAVLDAYFATQQRLDVPCTNTWETMMGLVLAPRGSAPGLDGIPYEVLQTAPKFTAALVAQAVHAAHDGPQAISRVIRSRRELLVWIPKADGGTDRPAFGPSSCLAARRGY